MSNNLSTVLLDFEFERQARQESAALRQRYELDVIERQVAAAEINRKLRLRSSRQAESKRLVWAFVTGLAIGLALSALLYLALKPVSINKSDDPSIAAQPAAKPNLPLPSMSELSVGVSTNLPSQTQINIPQQKIVTNSTKPASQTVANNYSTKLSTIQPEQTNSLQNITETFSIVAILSKDTVLIKRNNELNAQTVSLGQMLTKNEQLKQIFVDTKTIVTTTKTVTLE